MQKRWLALVATVTALVIVIGSLAILNSEGIIKPPPPPPAGKTVYFTIVEADPPSKLAGMNGSYYISPSSGPRWPVMNVTLGDTVVITIMNLNSSYEPHGFSIDHYLPDPGYTLVPGQVLVFKFVANEAGYFRVACSIVCAIHATMQNGALYVNS